MEGLRHLEVPLKIFSQNLLDAVAPRILKNSFNSASQLYFPFEILVQHFLHSLNTQVIFNHDKLHIYVLLAEVPGFVDAILETLKKLNLEKRKNFLVYIYFSIPIRSNSLASFLKNNGRFH